MKYFKHRAAPMVVTTVLAVAGCGGGGSSPGDSGMGAAPSPPITQAPPSPIVTDFTAFTRDLMASATTSDIDEPVELDSIEWVFADDENETAYDDIITASEP
jgi:hypothetical protein